MVTADVVVVGAGCVGASAAFQLSRLGVRNVTVLEAGLIASGPTGRSGAQLIPRSELPLIAALKWQGLEFYRRFEELTGSSADFRQTGYVAISGPAGEEALRLDLQNLTSLGSAARLMPAEQVGGLFGHITGQPDETALLIPEVGFADPVAATRGLLGAAQRAGALVREMTPVAGLLVRDGAVVGVETPAGRISAGAVVLATGIWTNRLLQPLGLAMPYRLHRVEVGIFRRPKPTIDEPIIADFSHGIYARPEGAYFTWIGTAGPGVGGELLPEMGDSTTDPDAFSDRASPRYMHELATRFTRRVPSAGLYFRRGHACVYDVTDDWLPLIDFDLGLANLAVACGMSGAGFVASTAIGRILAEGVVDRPANPEERAFLAPGRLSQAPTASYLV